MTKKTGKKLSDYEQSFPVQLKLFFDQENYSQTIELYHFVPKYVLGDVENLRIEGKFLEPIKRTFESRGKEYQITLLPARIETGDGEFKDYFMGVREEIVEDALLKLAVEGRGLMLDGELGLTFTVYEIQKLLKENNHTYSYDQVINALKILATATIQITSENGQNLPDAGKTKNGKKKELLFHPLETLAFQSGDEEKTPAFVRFSPLVTDSIKEHTFRLLNYKHSMRHSSFISRQIYRRMSHHFTQADITKPYTIMLSSIIRDFGLTLQSRLKNNLKNVEDALKEMVENDSILSYKIEKVYDSKRSNKLVDAYLKLTPSLRFSSDSKKFNARTRDNLLKLAAAGEDQG